ncbi:MAG: hypothetical protein ACTSU2_13415 [Promethearchaeota archaeon]
MVFKFLVGRVAKLVGRKVPTPFYMILYREIYKEILDITRDETKAARIMKEIGIRGTLESSQRQEQVLRLFPNDPKRVMEYLPIIWQTLFGTKMDDYKVLQEEVEDSDYPAIIYQIAKCPVCGGYSSAPEDTINVKKIKHGNSYYAAGTVGMLEEVANFILETRGNPYRINITETKCFCRGDNMMELYCKVLPLEKSKTEEEEDIRMKRPPTIDIDLDKLEELFTKPLDSIKEQFTKLVKEKLDMTPDELLDHFRNYEQDLIKIMGFLLIHLINENGRIIEKLVRNEAIAKVIGHLYKLSYEMSDLYMPREVIVDYQNLFIEFMMGLAPDEMVDSFKRIPAAEMTDLFYEGVKKALQDLGVNFDGLKRNIWEELEIQNALEKPPFESKSEEELTEEERKKRAEIKLRIIQEIFMLLNNLIGLPTKVFISGTHSMAKSMVSASGDMFTNIRNHIENIFDLAEQLKAN